MSPLPCRPFYPASGLRPPLTCPPRLPVALQTLLSRLWFEVAPETGSLAEVEARQVGR